MATASRPAQSSWSAEDAEGAQPAASKGKDARQQIRTVVGG